MLGGNAKGFTRTMTTAMALEYDKGEFVLGVALVVLIIIFVVSIFGRDNTHVDNQITSIDKRLGQIEDRLNKLELNTGGGKQIEEQNSKLEEVNAKISRLEASVALRMDQIAAEMNHSKGYGGF